MNRICLLILGLILLVIASILHVNGGISSTMNIATGVTGGGAILFIAMAIDFSSGKKRGGAP
jgi:hypothetical protein